MSLRGPVDPDHQSVTRFHLSSFLSGQPWSSSIPVLALEAQLPTGCPTTVHCAGAQVQKRRFEALGDFGAPGEVAELEKSLIDQPGLLRAERKAQG